MVSSLMVEAPGISSKINKEYIESLKGVFLSSNSHDTPTLGRLTKIAKSKRMELIYKTIHSFDTRVESVQPLSDGIWIGLKGFDELMPSNVLGDGMRKFLNIVSAIGESDNSIVLIDEIENGLHYTAHKLLWESMLSMAETFKTQLFITTHIILKHYLVKMCITRKWI